jgi:chorismate mutase
MYAVRGATTVENDDKEEILISTTKLIETMLQSNSIIIEDIISMLFTCTRDIKSSYPSEAARNLGITHAGLLCFQEMYVEGSMEKCIRILMLVNGEIQQKDVKHIFLNRAVSLRPDLMQGFNSIY